MGTSVLVARYSANDTYMRVTGTSVSCPLVAGMAALLLEEHPGWGPFEVREALRQTALNSGAPNNDIGWGLVQGQNAVNWVPSTTGVEEPAGDRGTLALSAGPNPSHGGTFVTIRFAAAAGDVVTLEAFDARGRRIARLFEGAADGGRTISWNGRDARGSNPIAGVYWLRLASRAGAGEKTMRIVLLP
jgi:subtilisin family serine protease